MFGRGFAKFLETILAALHIGSNANAVAEVEASVRMGDGNRGGFGGTFATADDPNSDAHANVAFWGGGAGDAHASVKTRITFSGAPDPGQINGAVGSSNPRLPPPSNP